MSTITRERTQIALPRLPKGDRVDAIFGALAVVLVFLSIVAKAAGIVG